MSAGHGSVPNAANFASLSALIVQCLDLVAHFSNEVDYLWKGRFNLVKGLYFLSRYIGLFFQIGNQVISLRFNSFNNASEMCPRLFASKSIICQVVLAWVEMILLIRVYALYNHTDRAKQFLLSIFITSTTFETVGNAFVVRSLARGTGCTPAKVNKIGIIVFAIGATLIQGVVILGTARKCISRGQIDEWMRTPLISLMLREGVATFMLIVALVLSGTALEMAHSVQTNVAVRDVGFSWYIALLSIAGSRLILNMRKLVIPVRHTSPEDLCEITEDSSICLTSVVESDF